MVKVITDGDAEKTITNKFSEHRPITQALIG
jgi:hypothetical protein